jgi:hypothetical protein
VPPLACSSAKCSRYWIAATEPKSTDGIRSFLGISRRAATDCRKREPNAATRNRRGPASLPMFWRELQPVLGLDWNQEEPDNVIAASR